MYSVLEEAHSRKVEMPPVTSPYIAAFPDGLMVEEEHDDHQRERTFMDDEVHELDASEGNSDLGHGVTEQDQLCATVKSGHYLRVV